jgi:hypothetical protein
MGNKEMCMKPEIIFVLVISALALGALIYLEIRSRRNSKNKERKLGSDEQEVNREQ